MSLIGEEREQRFPRASVLPLSTTVGHLIRRSQQVHTSLWGQELGGEITGPQYAVLSALTNAAVDQRSAGQIASLDKSTAADVVVRLERTGWLARQRDSVDRRRYLLTLSAPAKTALRHITPRVAEVQRKLLEPLAPDDRKRIVEALARIAYEGTPPGPPASADETAALPLATTPGHLIRRSEQLHGIYWARRVGTGITPPQYALMSAVAWNDQIDQSTAGELASLDKSSTTDILARLTRRGLVTSTPDPEDRRRKFVVLSAEARVVLDEVTPAVESVQRDVLAPLDEQSAQRLIGLLQLIAYR